MPIRSAAQRLADRNWRQRKEKSGLCNRCGKRAARPSRKLCQPCTDSESVRNKQSYQRRKQLDRKTPK